MAKHHPLTQLNALAGWFAADEGVGGVGHSVVQITAVLRERIGKGPVAIDLHRHLAGQKRIQLACLRAALKGVNAPAPRLTNRKLVSSIQALAPPVTYSKSPAVDPRS